MAGYHSGVLALICSCLLILPSWSENNQSTADYDNPPFPSWTRNNPSMINNDETPIIKEHMADLPYWTHNQTTDNQLKKGRERNAGEPHGKTKQRKKNKKIKNRNKKESKLEKKYKKQNKYKNKSTRIATCPNGWTSLTTGCYRLLPESGDAKTLEEAKRVCQSQGGFVVEIDSQNEQNALRQFWKNSNSGGISWQDWVWIGATDSAKEGEWRWIHSGKKMSFTAWYSGEPNNVRDEDCVIAGYLGGEEFKWTDIGCGFYYTGHKALCEYPGGPACTGTQSDLSCCSSESPCQEKQGDCDRHSECAGSLICGKDNCQDFNSKASRWADCCITKPGTGGPNDWDFCSITSPCQEKQGDCDGDSECAGSLICGEDNCNDFHPLGNTWADCCITAPEWSPWATWSGCTATCGAGTKTRKRTCSKSGGKTCPGNKEETIKCNLPSCGPCPIGWTSLASGCYQIVKTAQAVSYQGAMLNCKKENGYLVEMNTREEQDAIIQFLKDKKVDEHVWLGGSDKERTGTWIGGHSGEEIMKFNGWATSTGQPSHVGSQHCILTHPRRQFRWNDYWCDNDLQGYRPKAALCEYGVTNGCPIGWTSLSTGCYLFNEVSGGNYEEAKTVCQEKGGFLAEINNQEEQDTLWQFCQDNEIDNNIAWWLGATDILQEGEWKWARTGETFYKAGQSVTYDAFSNGEPNNVGNGEDCLVADSDGRQFEWVDIPCDTKVWRWRKVKALCEYSAGRVVSVREHETLELWCSLDGPSQVDISKALYGVLADPHCKKNFRKDTDIVKTKCQNRYNCHVEAINSIFGDPCHSKVKTLTVWYSCTGH